MFNVALEKVTGQMRARFKLIEQEWNKFFLFWSSPKSLTEEEQRIKANNFFQALPSRLD